MNKIISSCLKSDSGSFAPAFAILLVPLVLAVGLSTDYTLATSERSALRNALDAATLSIVTLPKETSEADRQKALQAAFLANGGQGTSKIESFSVAANGTVNVKASASYDMPTNFMQLAMIRTVKLNAASSVEKRPRLVDATFNVDKVSGHWSKMMTLYGVPIGQTAAIPLMQITYTYKQFKSPEGVVEPKGWGTSTVGIPDGKDSKGNLIYKTAQTMSCTTGMVASRNNAPAGSYVTESSYKGSPLYFSTTCDSQLQPGYEKGALIKVDQMDSLYLEMKVTSGSSGLFKSNDPATSDRLYIGNPDIQDGRMIEVQKGKVVDIFTAVPCGKTSNQAWEDGGNAVPADVSNADFFYNVTGKCGFSDRPSTTLLTQ